MMPENQDDFKGAVNIIKDFEAGGKTATIFTRDFLVARLPQKFQKYAITFGMDELTRLYLPSKKLRDKLAAADYDAVLDLNREENIFFSYLSNLVNSPLRAGIIKPGADKFYNLQIENSKDAPEIFYKNFLNCLQMF